MTSTTAPAPPGAASTRTEAMRKGRQADSARRRQRVIAALNQALDDGAEITVAGIARAAAVDRAFLYRHRDLLGKIHIPETVANLCFGGQQRNRLYICGSSSLYAVYTSAQGAMKP